jgi:hypothetical protein
MKKSTIKQTAVQQEVKLTIKNKWNARIKGIYGQDHPKYEDLDDNVKRTFIEAHSRIGLDQ